MRRPLMAGDESFRAYMGREGAVGDGFWIRIDWAALLIWTVVIAAISATAMLADIH